MKKAVLLLTLCSMTVCASAGIMIYPKYLSLDDKTKSAEVTLINSSALESSNYRVTLNYKKQNPDGSYTEVAEEEIPADSVTKLLRYSPRSVMLKPSQSQTVRVLKRLPKGLEPGDYVGYITFTEVLLEKAATKESLQPGAFSVKLTPIPSFSIPIFVHYKVKGNAPVSLETKGLVTQNNITSLNVVMNRQEQEPKTDKEKEEAKPRMIARGDLTVWDGNEMIGFVKGRYMLPATETLETRIPLRIQNAITNKEGKKEDKYLTPSELKGKTLKVLFTQADDDKLQKDKVLAQTEVKL